MVGDGISDRAKPKLIPTVLLTKKVHQPLRTVAFFLIKVDPADHGIHAQRQVPLPLKCHFRASIRRSLSKTRQCQLPAFPLSR